MEKFNVAIDGPAGAGKSTIAKAVAKKLGCIYIDTGAMYRAIGVTVLQKGIEPKDEANVAGILDDINMEIISKEDGQHILINGTDVNGIIRTPEASMAASAVATIPKVRLKLVDIQRKIASRNNVVMDGRDIGTYVLPNAEIKIFLTASVEERASRRHKELMEKGENCSLDEVIKDMIARDKQDSEREFAPLKQADDSILVDTTTLSLDESIMAILKIVEESKLNGTV
ncbi:MAG: (d)CMP kinase [Clostridia bacterium]|nr:(d)CMP kinase [Clostridia bacterium]